MKKGVIIIILLICLIQSILAVEISFSKESYQPQELFQAKITGNFLSLSEDNIFVYKEGKAHPEPIIKGLTKQKNIYYFYAILPNEEGNYTLRIKSAQYLERGIIKSNTTLKPIKIELKNQSDLYINPGFIIPKEDFSIRVKSLFGNTDVKAKFELTGEEKNIFLIEQSEEILKFKLPSFPSQESKIIINNYEIPVFLINKINETPYNLEFIPNIIEGTIISNTNYNFVILIRNPTENQIKNISFSSSLDALFIPSYIDILEPNKTILVNLTIKIGNINNNLSGKIKANSEKDEFYIPVNFFITKNESEVKVLDSTNPIKNPSENKLSCSQLGAICLDEQICNGDIINSIEGNCCIGICEERKSSTKIVGIILIILLILIIIYIIIKVRRKRKLKSSDEIFEEKQSKYKKRMNNEVTGKLDSV